MKNRFAKILSVLVVSAMPALAAAPERPTGTTLRRAPAQSAEAMRPARVIVKYKANGPLMRESTLSARDPDMAPVHHAARLSQRFGMALRDGYAIAPRTQVLFAADLTSAQLVARLQMDPDVEYAEVDERMHASAAPNDPLYLGGQAANVPAVGQWYLRPPTTTGQVSSINAEQAWDHTVGSPAIIVAVLDTGVRGDHPDLAGKLLPGYDFVSEDFPGSSTFITANDGDGRDADPSDPGDWVTQAESDAAGVLNGCDVDNSSWHGTQTSALIGASTGNGIGMASVGRNVRIVPVRVLGKCGGFSSDIIAAMYWAAGLAVPASTSDGFVLGTAPANPFPAKVLNMSLGSPGACTQGYQDAINAITAFGVSVVVAGGNGGGTTVGKPANCTGAIGVGGLRNVGTKVGFSDMGPELALSAPGGNCVNPSGNCLFPILTATNAGVTTPSATNTYSDAINPSIGTSFSAPLVSGAAALMLSANPSLTPAQIRSTLRSSVQGFPARPGSSTVPLCPSADPQSGECYCTTGTCGAGMLDVNAAVIAAGAPTVAQPLPFATPAAPAPTVSITLDGSTSVPGSGQTITAPTGYEWTMVSSGNIATLVGASPVRAPTATVTTTGEGVFSVQLKVTDSSNVPQVKTLTVQVSNPPAPSSNASVSSGGGGGALSWPWLLALGCAVLALRPRRTR